MLLRFLQGVIGLNTNTMGNQLLENLRKQLLRFCFELTNDCVALFNLLFGRAAVHGEILYPGADLQLESANALHEELVEIRVDD